MTFADEVLAMRDGKVLQRGTPEQLFEQPADTYVGAFIGSPGMNFMRAEQTGTGIVLGDLRIPGGTNDVTGGSVLQLGIRPEHIKLAAGKGGLPARVVGMQDLGAVRIVEFDLYGQTVKMKQSREAPMPEGDVTISLPPDKVRVYHDGRLVERSLASR